MSWHCDILTGKYGGLGESMKNTHTALELSNLIKKKELKVEEAVIQSISRIKELDSTYNCFISVDEEDAIKQAKTIQDKLDKAVLTGDMMGIPVAVKDNICTLGMETTCGSMILKNYQSPYEATAVSKMGDAGMIIIGKTNMDEFAMGNSTETSIFGATKNPYDIMRVAGGSSGGSAAAVSLDMTPVALGSDTGGSVRQPAAFCGVVGIKPTYGRVSRSGLVAYASSLDQIGTFGKNVKDAASLVKIISGIDKMDGTTYSGDNIDLGVAFSSDVRGMKVAVPEDLIDKIYSTDIKKSILKAEEILKAQGAVVSHINLGMSEYVLSAYYIIASAEASSNLERYDGVKYGYRAGTYDNLHQMYKKTRMEGFGEEVKRRIMLGSFVLSAGYYEDYYLKALKAKTIIKESLHNVFEGFDCILAPVTSDTAYLLGEYGDNPIDRYNQDIFTVWANLAGIPAMSLPCGKDEKGMPIGIQLMAREYNEETMIKLALAIENGLGGDSHAE